MPVVEAGFNSSTARGSTSRAFSFLKRKDGPYVFQGRSLRFSECGQFEIRWAVFVSFFNFLAREEFCLCADALHHRGGVDETSQKRFAGRQP